MLAAAWLQFMVHDWLDRGKGEEENPWELELQDDDPWHERPMKIRRNIKDPTRSPEESGLPPIYISTAGSLPRAIGQRSAHPEAWSGSEPTLCQAYCSDTSESRSHHLVRAATPFAPGPKAQPSRQKAN